MLASAILQLCPENDPTSSQRLQSLRERHSELRTVLSRKLGLVESVGELMQRVETSAEAVSSWDKSVSIRALILLLYVVVLLSNHPYTNNNNNSCLIALLISSRCKQTFFVESIRREQATQNRSVHGLL